MAHHGNQVPWEDLASVFQLKHANTCQHGAYNLHVLAKPDTKTKLANFLDAFIRSVTKDSIRQRKQYPQKCCVPSEDEVIISDEVAAKIAPTFLGGTGYASKDGAPIDDYRNIKAYQLAIRSSTQTVPLGDVAMYPHWDFFGIEKSQFSDGFCLWFHDDDTADDGVGLEADDESTKRSAPNPNDYFAYTLTFYPYGLISYKEFLNFKTPIGHQINPSNVTHVRWILYYTPRGSLPLSGKPLHPQYKMDIESLLQVEVENSLSELFRYKWQLYGFRLDHRGSAALRNLCLVCRQFRRIAQPLLYRTIVIEGRKGAKNIGTLLLRTLVENPQLAEQVRAVSLTDCVKFSEQVKILGKDATKALVRSAMEKLDIPHALKRMMKRLIASCGPAALILAYMPHVQVVDCTIGQVSTMLPWLLSASPEAGRPLGWLRRDRKVEYSDDEDNVKQQEEDDFSDDEYYVTKEEDYDFSDEEVYVEDYRMELSMEEYQQKGISKGTFANYHFANLSEIRIRAVENPCAIEDAWTIEPLLLNSTLKTLRTLGIAWYGDELDNLIWPKHKNYNLEYFDLMESYVDAEGLKTILTRCPKLKGISIRLPDEERQLTVNHEMGYGEEEECILNFDDFGDVLRKYGQNLQEFDFNTFFFESYSTWARNRGPGEGMIGSLRELRSLRHLGVSKEALIGEIEPLARLSEVLPESIETLHLYCGGIWKTEDWIESERELHNQDVYRLLLDGMPNLREIRVERCKTGFDGSNHIESYSDLYSDLDDAAADGDSCFSDNDPEGLYKLQFGSEEFMYSKEAEWPPELHVAGWVVDIVETSLYKIRGRPACDFRVITLTRKT
ncbi:hypothetical protein F52700_3689 [Fusarium sp. NRRL 52700]|nr:hypothetical protein F52700_3689 [Fusarium sp. NRRL 52700]